MRRAARGSPPDEAAMADPELVREYHRAMRPFATGRVAGYVNELTALTTRGRDVAVDDSANWRVLLGAHDFMHDPKQVLAYWTPLLPRARFEVVADAGRYLSLTHPQLIADALTADR
jgi:pimeloyl-ACP methyl ester carboxylesterase